MGGGGMPEDKSDEVARIEAQTAREAAERKAAEEAKALQEFQQRLSGAYDTGIQGAMDYFTTQGLDPDQYTSAITSRANTTRSGIPQLDANPGSYFQNLGQMVFEAEQEAARNKALRSFDTFAPSGFSSNRIADTTDDPFIESILGERQKTAMDYLNNLLARGVVTQSGFDAGRQNIEGQAGTARARLNEIGMGELNRGRTSAENIANEGRTAASNLRLGSAFDPFSYSTRINSGFEEFFSGLGDRLRAAAPTDLFTTSGLANVAGAAQGAQNTPFDPKGIAGLFDEEEDEETSSTNPF